MWKRSVVGAWERTSRANILTLKKDSFQNFFGLQNIRKLELKALT